ncbi:hypothetical protein ACFX1W_003663 [Malus domestica]
MLHLCLQWGVGFGLVQETPELHRESERKPQIEPLNHRLSRHRTRPHSIDVFGYRVDGDNGTVFDFENDGLVSMWVNPGLPAYAEDPESAGVLLRKPVESGKGRIPNEHWAETEIRLMAT